MGKWEIVKLEDVANINMGQSPESSTYNQIGEGVPFYQGNADFGERYPVKRFWCTVPKKLSAKDDILISVRAPIGAMNFSIETCCIGRGLASITPNPKKLEQKYLWYILKSNYNFLNRQGTGSTFKAINKKILTDLLIPLPPLDEQKRIAKNIDLASEIVKGYKDQLAELDKLVQSVFYEMFGDPVTNGKRWKISVFADICKVRQGLQIPISKRKKIPGDNRYVYITVQFLNGRKQKEYIENPKQTVVCNKDDVLMTRTGNTGMVVTDVEGVFHNNFFLIDFNRNILDKNYLVKYLTLDVIKTELLLRAGNSTIPDLNHSEFYKIKIPIPPIYIQTRFAEIVTEIESQKAQIQQALTEAENLFNSLMQEYFE